MCYVHYGDFTLRELDYTNIVIISFGYILYCFFLICTVVVLNCFVMCAFVYEWVL
jgi:hypothetical protein